MAEERWKLEVPYLPRMKASQSCYDLWRSMKNEAVYRFESYLRAVLGGNIRLMRDDTPEAWASAQRMVAVLEGAVGLLNYLLVVSSGDDRHQDLGALQDWLGQWRGSAVHQEATLAREILENLRGALFLHGPEAGGSLDVDGLIALVREEPESAPPARVTFDAFISYKHQRYSREAEALWQALGRRGLRCWIDRHNLALTSSYVPEVELKRKLRQALRASRCTVFFETWLEATAGESFRGDRRAFSWQVFEQRWAHDLIYIYPQRGQIDFVTTRQEAAWTGDIEQAAEQIAAYMGTGGAGWSPPDRAPAEPDLREAVSELHTAAADYFATPVDLDPLASLALLAPGEVDQAGNERSAFADDVLINLLRLDPVSALAVTEAGLDLVKLFAVGTKLTVGRWARPGSYMLRDVFGHEPPVGLVRGSRLDTDGVLRGIFQAAGQHSYGRDLLLRTLRYMRHEAGPAAGEATVAAECDQVRERLADRSRQTAQHGWLFLSTAQGWRAHPVVACGYWSLEPGQGLPVNAVVLYRQSAGLYPEALVHAVDEAVNAGAATLSGLLDERPELALTFAGRLSTATALDLTPGGETPMFLYDLDGSPAAGGPGDLWTAMRAALAAPPDYQGVGPDGPFRDRRPQPAVLLSAAFDWRAPDRAVSFLELCAIAIVPLQQYGWVRDLEYDDFPSS
jgi:hypothetical protein